MFNKKILKEGIDDSGAPDEKYYAFDWDDNIVTMPTKIILKDNVVEIVNNSIKPNEIKGYYC